MIVAMLNVKIFGALIWQGTALRDSNHILGDVVGEVDLEPPPFFFLVLTTRKLRDRCIANPGEGEGPYRQQSA